MKKIAIIQSNYIPWKGYFHIIQKVDHFVFLDTAQYTCRDWRNRNLIKTPDGKKWLTVPTDGTQSKKINEVKIDNSTNWQYDHYQTLKHNYSCCEYYKDFIPLLDEIYMKKEWISLSELNQYFIRKIAKILNIKTQFHNSNEFILPPGKNEKIISIIHQMGGTHYVSGPSAADYIKPELFEINGIDLEFMDYSNYLQYPQPWNEFIHGVTILDLLFCTGSQAAKYIWS